MDTVAARVGAYVPQVLQTWITDEPATRYRCIDATLVHVDISGFTALAERLASRGRIGAEELTDAIDACFSALLEHVYASGGRLLKFGGDALLLFFEGADHARRGARAACGMRTRLLALPRVSTSGGSVRLSMTVGVRSGVTHLLLVGDVHRELVICGPAATEVVAAESAASSGEIVVTRGTADAIPAELLGAAKGPGVLLLQAPSGDDVPVAPAVQTPVEELLKLLPAALREHLQAGSSQEHRRVSVGFVQIQGLDRVAPDPDGTWAALDDTMRVIQAAAQRHRVTMLGSDVDVDATKVILAAGAPVATGDDEERLLLVAREILDAAPPLPVRIGTTAGHVFAGDVGPVYRRTYTVMGDAVNLAARLMAASEPGTLLTTPSMLDATRTVFATQALTPMTVKGKAAPVRAVRVDGVVGRRAEAGDASAALPLIGRDQELGTLLGSVDRARAGRGIVVEIVGEAGIGKSRLLQELVARSSGTRIVVAAGELFRAATPYGVIRMVLREALGLPSDADDARTVDRLHELTVDELPELAPWAPLLAVPLGVDVPRTPEVDALEGRFRRPRLQALVAQVLDHLWPDLTLLLVEDVQWSDEASHDLLRSLTERVLERPWVVCTTRREADPSLGTGEGFHELLLGPLSAGASARLGAQASDAAPLPAHVMEVLLARSGGNPLYLQELVLAATDLGELESLPDSVESLVTARLDRLPSEQRRALRSLSVLGTTFDRELADALLDTSTFDLAGLAGFVRADAEVVAFEHALLRDAAYEGLPYRARRELHARAADAITALPADRTGLLSVHAYLAGRYADAWRASVSAGRGAAGAFANADAAGFLRRALRAAGHVRAVGSLDRAEVEELLGDVLQRMGDGAGAAAAYSDARERRRGDPLSCARLLLKQARSQAGRQRFSQALASITRGLRLLEGDARRDAGALRAQLAVWYGHFRQEQGKHADALRWSQLAESEAEAVGERDALAHALQLRDWVYAERGEPELAVNSLRALELYEELGELSRQAAVLNNLGGIAFWEGRWVDAADYYRRAQVLDERTGDVLGAAFGRNNLAEILADQGRVADAEELLRGADRTFRAAGYTAGVAYVGMNLGRCAARAGRFEEARRVLGASIDGSTSVGAASTALEAEARLAEVELLAGRADEALAAADEVLARAAATEGVAALEPLLHRVRGAALLLLGDLAASRAAFEASRQAASVREAAYDVALADHGLAVVAQRGGTDASVPTRASSDALEQLGVVALPYPADLTLAT